MEDVRWRMSRVAKKSDYGEEKGLRTEWNTEADHGTKAAVTMSAMSLVSPAAMHGSM